MDPSAARAVEEPATPAALPVAGEPVAGMAASMLPLAGTLMAGECVTTGTIEAKLRPANLLFLVDRREVGSGPTR